MTAFGKTVRLWTALSLVCGWPLAAQADCTLTNGTATCTGDLSPGFQVNDVSNLIVDELTSDIVNLNDLFVAILGDNSRNTDESAADLFLSYTGSSFSLETTGGGIIGLANGGPGSNGREDNPFVGDATGGNGTPGGGGGVVTLVVNSGTVRGSGPSTLLEATSIGGFSGNGGEGVTSTLGTGTGGEGAEGATGGSTSIAVVEGSFQVEGDSGQAFSSASWGSDGGDGGEGKSGGGTTHGGAGGAGGFAPVASLTVFAATVTGSSGSLGLMEASSRAGDGGTGGVANTDTSFGSANAGNGGDGGASEGTTLTFDGGTFSYQGSPILPGEEDLLLAESRGGDGGGGGEARNTAANANAGKGGSGGRAGQVEARLNGGSFTVGTDAGSAIFLQSRGGDGGNGGEGETFGVGSGQGGDGGSGGDASSVTVSSLSPGVIITTTSISLAQHGLRAESLAGGGGDGGEGKSNVAGNGLGGNGGQGGAGGSVEVQLIAEITTLGPGAQGLFARSYGGDGGNGGAGSAGIGSGNGGAAAGSGPAGNAEVSFAGTIETSGLEANAIIVQSVGGFSGDAGSSSGFLAYGAGSQSAGDGGTVSAEIAGTGSITTKGNWAAGVLAQSIGGGGGRGSEADALGALGGDGSAAGDGGAVTVNATTGGITTEGQGSRALHAGSRGGGGGDGGASVGILAIGGSAGQGGQGGTVSVTNLARLTTSGDQSDALYGASLGGGGGSAHSEDGIFAIGGSGGSGGDGGAVSANSSGDISTAGDDADGIFLSSIGGGGGDGSSVISLGVGVAIGIGGSGGQGGSGGAVSFDDQGAGGYSIETSGERARGLSATSVGGGGGDGGYAVSGGISPGFQVTIGASGGGGAAGSGGAVSITSGAAIATKGGNAGALVAQSTGGGGGSAGTTVTAASGTFTIAQSIGGSGGPGGDGGAVSVAASGDLSSEGDHSAGLAAYSQGGGGGTGGTTVSGSALDMFSITHALGGAGKAGGAGGDVTVTGSGSITTLGNISPGLYAHSVSGSGGSAGTTAAASAITNASLNLAVGADGGAGKSAGSVMVEVDRAISTAGNVSPGLAALSQGGSGGHSAVTLSGSLENQFNLNATVGGSGGSGGDGGLVKVSFKGAISTQGHSSGGVEARSIGGGGGVSHFSGSFSGESTGSVQVTVGGRGGTAGDGEAVTVGTAGDISTQGHYARAISAMSIGGGGGDSGMTASGGAANSSSLGVSVGGDGGASGSGGAVMVTTAANTKIDTKGALSEGILAQSIARSGGSAGHVLTGSLLSGAVGISVGGSGGSGGSAGGVEVTNAAAITTLGAYSSAIEGRSVAGGGGTSKGSITTAALTVGDANITVGGDGGDGGQAGKITIASQGKIATGSHHAFGVLGQSIGGAGGNGGFAAQGSLTGGEVSGDLSFSIGGSGGNGGSAAAAEVTASSTIATSDFGAKGILVQSIGGAGGAGGNVYSGNLSLASKVSANVNVEIGGSGGDGATAGEVTVENAATIMTDGFLADGIAAQSIGGNGGDGGSTYSVLTTIPGDRSAAIGVDVGGAGGSGQDAATASVVNAGAITTAKSGSHAILAMSIGGGGGRGGAAANINVQPLPSSIGGADNSSSLSGSIDVGVGGKGGAAGNGGKVEVSNTSSLSTAGKSSRAIYASSIGGGGGDGGTASSTSFTFNGLCSALTAGAGFGCKAKSGDNEKTTDIAVSLSAEIGGSGGAAGDGDSVSVTNQGKIETSGRLAHAIVAHSIGGGGGEGGEGDIGIEAWTNNATANALANGPADFTFIPNLGDLSAGVGGSGGAAGNGGSVSVKGSQNITTTGDHAFAIRAQSIGGGGGNAGAGSTGNWGAVTVGGRGSGGGDGGIVRVVQEAAIATSGKGSIAIFAQSVGGGGGTAGDIERGFSDSWLDLNIGVGLGVQESAGGGGDGGDISVTAGPISTSGDRAHAILAQSVGGSGGIASISGDLGSLSQINTFAGSAGDRGNGGAIAITIDGPISVVGEGAQSIVAQSTSGTLNRDDASGDITIAVKNNVVSSGQGGRAILAQSQGGTSGKITISIADDAVVSAAADGQETIGLFDGNDNLIVNNGTLVKAGGAAASGFVIRTNGTAALTVENNGLIEGSLKTALSTSTAAPTAAASAMTPQEPRGITVMNNPGASFALGSEVELGGAAGALINAGRISAGGPGSVARSALKGVLTQSDSGQTWVDFDFAGGNDLIVVSQATGNAMAGRVIPNPLGGTPMSSEDGAFAILRVSGTLDSSDLSVESTSTVDYGLRQRTNSADQQAVLLSYEVNYTPWNGSETAQAKVPGALRSIISPNHTAFGQSMNGMIDAAAPGTEDFISDLTQFLLTTEDVADLVDAYDRFAPGEIFAPSDAALFSSLRFSEDLNSCPAEGPDGNVIFTRQGSCIWLQVNGGGIDRQRTTNSIEYDESFVGVSLGGQTAVGDGFFIGGAFGYEDSNLSNGRFNGDGSRFQGGIVAKKEIEATTLSASFSGGVGLYDLSRQVITPGGTVTADSSPNTNWISGHARVAHVVDLTEQLYLKPWFDIGVDHQWQGAFSETGAGDYGLDVEAFRQTLVTVNPVLEFGGGFSLFGAEANASASAGLLAIVSGRNRTTGVRLRGMGGFGPSYQISDQARPLFADLGASLDVRVHERAVLSFGGQALLAGNQQEYGGTGRVSIFF